MDLALIFMIQQTILPLISSPGLKKRKMDDFGLNRNLPVCKPENSSPIFNRLKNIAANFPNFPAQRPPIHFYFRFLNLSAVRGKQMINFKYKKSELW